VSDKQKLDALMKRLARESLKLQQLQFVDADTAADPFVKRSIKYQTQILDGLRQEILELKAKIENSNNNDETTD
jgi:hypothetical protein